MDRFTRMLAALLGRSAGLLPEARREWAEAALAEVGEVPPGARRVAWLCGGFWLVVREVGMGQIMRALTFAGAAVGLVLIGWPGASSDSATPLNRVYVTGTVVMLAVLPRAVHRYFGPVRGGWAPRAARVGAYAVVLVLIAAKAVRDSFGSKLGAYFVIVPEIWLMEIVLLLVIVGYVGALFILTSERSPLIRWALPMSIGLGVVTAGLLFVVAPFGVGGPWVGVAALALPTVTGVLAGRLAVQQARPVVCTPKAGVRQGWLAATCAAATAALLLAVLTAVTIALFPHRVPLQTTPGAGGGNSYIAGGGCETCEPVNTVIPRGLRHEYLVEISVGQAGTGELAFLMVAPLVGAGLGAIGGGLGARSAGARGRAGGPSAASSRTSFQPLGSRASNADREQVIGVLKGAFSDGRLTKDEFDTRVGHALTSQTYADLAALTADCPDGA